MAMLNLKSGSGLWSCVPRLAGAMLLGLLICVVANADDAASNEGATPPAATRPDEVSPPPNNPAAIRSTASSPAEKAETNVPADEASRRFESLMATWEAQQSEIITADVDYWIYSQVPEGQWTREEFADLLAKFDFVANPESLREFVPLVMGRPAYRDPPWGVGRLVADGLKKRDQMGPFDNVQDGEYEYLRDADNRQLLVYELDRSRRYIRGIESLRWVPRTYISPAGFDVVTSNDDEVVLVNRNEGSRLTVDPATAMARHWLSYARPGELMLEIWQQGFATYDDGIVLPQVQIEARYHQNHVSGFHVMVLRKGVLNQPVAAQEFQVATSPNLKIFDYRNGVASMVRLEVPTEDLRSQLPAVVPPPLPVTIPESGRPFPWLFVLNGLVLLIAGVLLWRSSPKSQNATITPTKDGSPQGAAEGPPDQPAPQS